MMGGGIVRKDGGVGRQLSALINFLRYREDMGHLDMQALDEVIGVFRRFGDAMCRCFLVIPLRTFYNIRIVDVFFSLFLSISIFRPSSSSARNCSPHSTR